MANNMKGTVLSVEENNENKVIEASIYYLRRLDLYKAEKPYMLTFDPSGLGGSRTNHDFAATTIKLRDAQPIRSNFQVDIHGFEFHTWSTALESSDFDNDLTVKEKYYPEIISKVRDLRPEAVEFVILTHLRRKRPLKFTQIATEEPIFEGPVVYAHIDFTTKGAAIALKQFFQRPDCSIKHREKELLGRRYELLNVWRVTKGPNQDWPLAVCDYTTVNARKDLEETDIIHKTWVGESGRFYHNSDHRWYYLDKQQVDDVVVFRNTDSRGIDVPYCAHLAFDNLVGQKTTSVPRESIEVRMACFY